MIEFFEFLNSCSPSRTVAYLIFICIFSFIIFAGVSDIISRLKGGNKIEDKIEEEKVEDTNG